MHLEKVSVSDRSNVRSPASVLLVDDDDFALETMRDALAPLMLSSIATASDGLAALRQLKSSVQLPDLLICDVYMPNMDGIEFLDQLGQMQFKVGRYSGQWPEYRDARVGATNCNRHWFAGAGCVCQASDPVATFGCDRDASQSLRPHDARTGQRVGSGRR